MSLINLFINILGTHQILIIFLGSFFFGESIIISLALLSADGLISLPFLFIFGFLGTIISDSMWFYIGKYGAKKNYLKQKIKKHKKLITSINKITGKKPFVILLFSKFMYGTRIFFMMYLAVRKLAYSTFLLFNTIGTTIWLTTLITVGWLAGQGTKNFIPVLEKGKYLISIIIILLIILRVITLWVTKKITKE